LSDYSLDTVKMFKGDAEAAGYKLWVEILKIFWKIKSNFH
jgi:hypothetical protein